jgi:hypothetical protein
VVSVFGEGPEPRAAFFVVKIKIGVMSLVAGVDKREVNFFYE